MSQAEPESSSAQGAKVAAVTGVTGFIGKAVLSALTADGWRIRALVRRKVQLPAAELIHGSLLDRPALDQLLKDADAVIHCAGRVRGASAREFAATNVEGTIRLAQAAASRSRRPRFLYISSLAAREPGLSWYAESKRQAEIALAEQAGMLPHTVFRPTAVYGPGDRELRPLFTAMRYGILPAPGRNEARFSLLHVDDLVHAIRRWLIAPVTPEGPYELHDGTPDGYTWPGVCALAEQTLNRRVVLLPIPARLLDVLAHCNLRLARIIGYSPMLTPGKLRELRYPDWRCDNGPISRDLGWQPRITLADSLRRELLSPAA